MCLGKKAKIIDINFVCALHGKHVLGCILILYAGTLVSDHRSFLAYDIVWANSFYHTLSVGSQASFFLLFPFSSLPASQTSPSTSLISPAFPAHSGSFRLLSIQPLFPFSTHSWYCSVLSTFLFSSLFHTPGVFIPYVPFHLFPYLSPLYHTPLCIPSSLVVTPLLLDTISPLPPL